MSESAIRGFEVFLGDGRCVSCHTIEQDHALFTDNRFHNIGVGINRIQTKVPQACAEVPRGEGKGIDVDKAVLTDPDSSELGRFAVTDGLDELGAFKTPTLRNVASPPRSCTTAASRRCAPWSSTTTTAASRTRRAGQRLPERRHPAAEPDGRAVTDLVAFLEALTSPQHAKPAQRRASQGRPPRDSRPREPAMTNNYSAQLPEDRRLRRAASTPARTWWSWPSRRRRTTSRSRTSPTRTSSTSRQQFVTLDAPDPPQCRGRT